VPEFATVQPCPSPLVRMVPFAPTATYVPPPLVAREYRSFEVPEVRCVHVAASELNRMTPPAPAAT